MEDRTALRRHEILEGNLLRTLFLLAVPVMLDNFMNAMFNLIDTFFVSGIGMDVVAAVTFVTPINDVVKSVSIGLSVTCTVLVGRAIGKADKNEEMLVCKHLMLIALLSGIGITTYIFFNGDSILVSASITDDLLPVAGRYFQLTTLSTPITLLNSVYFGLKRAQGETALIFRINAVSIIFKIILAYLLIYQMNAGLMSLIVSTLLSQLLILVYACFDGFLKYSFELFRNKKYRLNKAITLQILKIGIPSVIEKASLSFGFVVINSQVLFYGEEVLAAYGITNKINSVLFSTVAGLGTGLAIVITQNLAVHNTARIQKAIKISLLMGFSISTVIGVLLLLTKVPVVSLMTRGNAAVFSHTIDAMSVYSISVIPWSILYTLLGVFQGYGKTEYNLLISFMRVYVFRLPIVRFLQIAVPNINEYSIWYGMLLANILTATVAYVLYKLLLVRNKLDPIRKK